MSTREKGQTIGYSPRESTRKDVKRAFEVLQIQFLIVHGPVHGWSRETLIYNIKVFMIMHNMSIEDEQNTNNARMTLHIVEKDNRKIIVYSRNILNILWKYLIFLTNINKSIKLSMYKFLTSIP
jgi:hypothetical protein